MSEEFDKNEEIPNTYHNHAFERSYGDVLTEIILIMYPEIKSGSIGKEKDIFYYKLKILESLIDRSNAVPKPSENIISAFSGGMEEEEFDDFKQQATFILEVDPTATQILTNEVLQKCDAVIANPELVSFYLNFKKPKPRNLN